jgi:hypothetical protein
MSTIISDDSKSSISHDVEMEKPIFDKDLDDQHDVRDLFDKLMDDAVRNPLACRGKRGYRRRMRGLQ